MPESDKHCEMIGCHNPVYKALQIAPGTVVKLCEEHYEEENQR